jgi:NAD(P)-dependent dehydrogenase (short-subunit alcohol dehydrogenase family)
LISGRLLGLPLAMSGEVCLVAGLMASQRRVTADGYDEVCAVNHLAPFLPTNLLLGKLASAAPARVITVTSDAHTAARLDALGQVGRCPAGARWRERRWRP